MKNSLIRLSALLLLLPLFLFFTGCSFLSDFGTTGNGDTSTASTTGGIAPPASPVEIAIAATEASDPTRIDFTVRSVYREKAIALTAELTLIKNGESTYCSYRTDRLLTLDEAEKTGEPIGSFSGFVRLEGNDIVGHSADIDVVSLIDRANSLTLFAPAWTPQSFTSVTWEETEEGPVFSGVIRPEYIPMLFGLEKDEKITSLSLRLTLSKERDRLTGAQYRYTTGGGADVTADAVFSYTVQSIPNS